MQRRAICSQPGLEALFVAARRVAGYTWRMQGGHGGDCKRHAAVALGVVNKASRFRITDSDRAMAVSLYRAGVHVALRRYVSYGSIAAA